jgi:hypothetical protein
LGYFRELRDFFYKLAKAAVITHTAFRITKLVMRYD